MRRTFTLILSIICVSLGYAQEFDEYYAGENYSVYKGGLLTVNKSKSEMFFYYTFYKGIPERKGDQTLSINKKNELTDRVFKVDSIFTHQYYSSNTATEKTGVILFKLTDTKTNEVIYYRYNPKNEPEFLFFVANVKIDESALLKNIVTNKDKYTDVTLITSLGNYVNFSKRIADGKEMYFLSLSSYQDELSKGGKGVIVLFRDGTKWVQKDFPVEVERKETWNYKVFMPITVQDMNLFQTKEIEGYKIHAYSEEIGPIMAQKLKFYANTIRKQKAN